MINNRTNVWKSDVNLLKKKLFLFLNDKKVNIIVKIFSFLLNCQDTTAIFFGTHDVTQLPTMPRCETVWRHKIVLDSRTVPVSFRHNLSVILVLPLFQLLKGSTRDKDYKIGKASLREQIITKLGHFHPLWLKLWSLLLSSFGHNTYLMR